MFCAITHYSTDDLLCIFLLLFWLFVFVLAMHLLIYFELILFADWLNHLVHHVLFHLLLVLFVLGLCNNVFLCVCRMHFCFSRCVIYDPVNVFLWIFRLARVCCICVVKIHWLIDWILSTLVQYCLFLSNSILSSLVPSSPV